MKERSERMSSDEGAVFDRLVMRLPSNKEERLFAALNSRDSDILAATNGQVYVTGRNKDGEVIELGHIGIDVFFSDRKQTTRLIDHIRFGCS